MSEAASQPPALAAAGPPPLEQAGPGGPPPLEAAAGGPPPLEEPALPPGLKPPPPLEPPAANGAASAPPPLAPPVARALSLPQGSDAASPEAIRDGIIDYLRKKPGSKDLLNRLGLYLRSRKLAPDVQLKRFIQQHCAGRVVVIDSKTGTDMAQLAEAAERERAAAAAAERERERAAAAATATPAQAGEASKRPMSAASAGGDMSFDPSWLEQRLMQHCVELRRAGTQPSLPLLGNFCINQLGLQLRGKLKPFLDRRPQLCSVSDDGRQHVLLTPAGAILGGGTTADAAPAATAGAPAAPPAAPAAAPLARLAEGGLPGGSASGAATTEQVAAAVMPGVAAAASAAKDYKKWDPLTKEIFQFVRSKGVATFSQIDAHIKATAAKHIAVTGIPLSQWRSQFFLHKRRNIFRLQGPVVSLSSYIPDAEDSPSESSSTAAPPAAEEFPPLPGTTAAPPPPAAAPAAVGASSSSAQAGAAPAAAAAAGENPLLAAFAAERQLMEQLRDDVQAKLASFKALSELQKENSGLRAACVTLGRELLSLKSEFTTFQQQTLAALAAVNPNAAAMLLNPSPAASPMEVPMVAAPAAAAGEAAAGAAAAGAAAEQLHGYQAVAAEVQHQQQFAATALSAGGTPTAAEVEAAAAAAAAVAPPLPAHMPAAAAPAAAAAAPQRELPRGDIVLVGGHDSGSWLDSVDYFSPHDCVWASLPLLGKPRSFSAAVGTANEVFIAGGGDGLEWYDSVVRYDRKAGLMGGWQELAPLQVARGSLAAAVAGGYLFVYGGGKPNEQYNVVEWYDPTSNRWLPGPPLQRKRFALGGAAMDGAIYAVGGYDGSTYLDCAERLDPRTDRWEMLPGSMASKRGGHAVAAAGGQLYALGGFNSVQAIPHCEAYEPRMNAWRQIADMSDARAYGSSASLGSTVFAVGGLQSDMQTHAILIECYNPVVDVWEHVELPPNANPRRSFLAACGIE
ncbi:kelch 1 [Chlorella sorokiniana]|uniref:Kelch 1 n=1 Tax=Chlorella sorokiniana TaxID=3076 RepID=A0A2P6TZB0_CHLSO|nr:kelch 1 [Chlorella sorokiniana]|eukprot:PRW59406.1 kelch 1 [Chlorella sorokiniana]